VFSVAVPIEQGSPTLLGRIVAKLVEDPVTGCWNWTGAFSLKNRGKRPVIQLGGRGTRVVLVARLLLTWYAGPPPTDQHEAGHTCPHGENSRCVNPGHLAWQTRTENEQQKKLYE
jgi:hypothetical protein